MSKLYEKYLKKITDSTLGERDIIALRSQLNARRKSSMSDDERDLLVEAITDHRPRVSDEQARKGIDWLFKQWKTPTGATRKHNPFGDYEQYILDNFDHFLLIDLFDASTSMDGLWPSYLPVYRVISKGGRSFDYVSGCWQAGENMSIIS